MNQQKTKRIAIISFVAIVSFTLIATGMFLYLQQPSSATEEVKNDTDPEITEPVDVIEESATVVISDTKGARLTDFLRKNGYNLGFINSNRLAASGVSLPSIPQNYTGDTVDEPDTLQSIAPKPEVPVCTNELHYPQYNVYTPIIYANFEDTFGTNTAGEIDVSADPGGRNDGVETPIQVKLKDGVVHLPFSVQPGDVGSAYIMGHTSNYVWVKSDYNTIFRPLMQQTKVGEEFTICDSEGRILVFRVFDNVEIEEQDVATAYKVFPGKRVVTLQGSVLVNGIPSRRWLTRGEFVRAEDSITPRF